MRGIRWYGDMFHWTGPTGTAQIDDKLQKRDERGGLLRNMRLPEPVLRMAQAEYDIQHPGQPYERMQQRGGLSVLEIVALLADRIQRLESRAAVKGGANG